MIIVFEKRFYTKIIYTPNTPKPDSVVYVVGLFHFFTNYLPYASKNLPYASKSLPDSSKNLRQASKNLGLVSKSIGLVSKSIGLASKSLSLSSKNLWHASTHAILLQLFIKSLTQLFTYSTNQLIFL